MLEKSAAFLESIKKALVEKTITVEYDKDSKSYLLKTFETDIVTIGRLMGIYVNTVAGTVELVDFNHATFNEIMVLVDDSLTNSLYSEVDALSQHLNSLEK